MQFGHLNLSLVGIFGHVKPNFDDAKRSLIRRLAWPLRRHETAKGANRTVSQLLLIPVRAITLSLESWYAGPLAASMSEMR